VTGRWWLIGAAAALAIGAALVTSSSGCSSCDDPPPQGCFPAPGATHQEACASCGAGYTGCREGQWVTIPCGAVVPARDGGR